MQIIPQETFFQGTDFKRRVMIYPFGSRVCFESPAGHFYRIDHFSDVYVIEFAENEADAVHNMFEDDDCFKDSLPREVLIKMIQESILSDEPHS